MDTRDTPAIEKGLRSRLLTYSHTGASGAVTLADAATLGGRLWIEQAPDGATFPYGVMMLRVPGEGARYKGERKEGELEVMLYANTSAHRQRIKQAADIVEAAFHRFIDSVSGDPPGLVFARGVSRAPLPHFTAPADAELFGERVLVSLTIWPQFLMQYRDT